MSLRYILFVYAALASAIAMLAEKIEDRQGWVWEYADYSYQYDGVTYHYMRLGDEVEICGKQYTRFNQFKTIQTAFTSFAEGEIHDREVVYEKEGDLYSTFFREEGNRTYIPIYSKNYIICIGSEIHADTEVYQSWDDLDIDKFEEVKIYDYDLPESEIWEYPAIYKGMGYGEDVPLTVIWGNPISVNGVSSKVMHLRGNGVVFIENIGIESNGMYTLPLIDFITGKAPDNLDYPGEGSVINRVFDGEGTIIYQAENAVGPYYNSLSEISDHKSRVPVCYDTFGRVISNPLPGTVYIRDGKKYVAR